MRRSQAQHRLAHTLLDEVPAQSQHLLGGRIRVDAHHMVGSHEDPHRGGGLTWPVQRLLRTGFDHQPHQVTGPSDHRVGADGGGQTEQFDVTQEVVQGHTESLGTLGQACHHRAGQVEVGGGDLGGNGPLTVGEVPVGEGATHVDAHRVAHR